MKKTLSHILLPVFCLHFLRMHHNYFFQRGFEDVRAQLWKVVVTLFPTCVSWKKLWSHTFKGSLEEVMVMYNTWRVYLFKPALHHPFKWNQSISFITQLIETSRLLHFSTNWCYLLDVFYFFTTLFLLSWKRFIHFGFQLVEKIEHIQAFQLIEINFHFVENLKIFVITWHNLLISRNQVQLFG